MPPVVWDRENCRLFGRMEKFEAERHLQPCWFEGRTLTSRGGEGDKELEPRVGYIPSKTILRGLYVPSGHIPIRFCESYYTTQTEHGRNECGGARPHRFIDTTDLSNAKLSFGLIHPCHVWYVLLFLGIGTSDNESPSFRRNARLSTKRRRGLDRRG